MSGSADAPVLQVENAGKRFCRRLRTSLRYGAADILRDLAGRSPPQKLRTDEFWALQGVSFELKRGECLGLLGTNGAGKSTLLKMIAGLIKPDAGKITVRGRVGALIELGAGMHPLLSGRENIFINASILGLNRRETKTRLDEIIAFSGLEDFIDSPVQSYSSGMRVRLGFAVAAHLEPDVLLVDEVLAVGDMAFRLKCYRRIADLRTRGTVIVLVSHQPIDLLRTTDLALWLKQGKLQSLGKTRPLLARYLEESTRSSSTSVRPSKSPLQITNVSLSPPHIITSASTLCTVAVEAYKVIPHVRILVHIESTAGDMLGSFASTLQDFHPRLAPGRHQIAFRLHDLPLLAGEYFIHIALHGPKIDDLYDVWRHRTLLIVGGSEPDPYGFGTYHHVHFQHEWLPVEPLS